MLDGREFHVLGPVTENALAPVSVLEGKTGYVDICKRDVRCSTSRMDGLGWCSVSQTGSLGSRIRLAGDRYSCVRLTDDMGNCVWLTGGRVSCVWLTSDVGSCIWLTGNRGYVRLTSNKDSGA
ncbi:hypothetical protein E2C01_031851 [Portunus trituberculatus]|uniref:Uncharacterized protein n=1 Tax=Portunus trituberculatus TaxID=210409 RepID=A0A5B7EY27_PORTR|nr:hypothetical protein [Portunus trituberculatus]